MFLLIVMVAIAYGCSMRAFRTLFPFESVAAVGFVAVALLVLLKFGKLG